MGRGAFGGDGGLRLCPGRQLAGLAVGLLAAWLVRVCGAVALAHRGSLSQHELVGSWQQWQNNTQAAALSSSARVLEVCPRGGGPSKRKKTTPAPRAPVAAPWWEVMASSAAWAVTGTGRAVASVLGGGGSAALRSLQGLSRRRYRLLVLFSDTGGGHRASAMAIAQALEKRFPGRFEVELLDIWTAAGVWPLNRFVSLYRYLGRRPWLWRVLWYGTANYWTRGPIRTAHDAQHRRRFAREMAARRPIDGVLSVHPLTQHVPISALRYELRWTNIPFVTVVTDLGSAHPMWFDSRADRVFVPNARVAKLAHFHGVPKQRITMHGLPLRAPFFDAPPRQHRSSSSSSKPQQLVVPVPSRAKHHQRAATTTKLFASLLWSSSSSSSSWSSAAAASEETVSGAPLLASSRPRTWKEKRSQRLAAVSSGTAVANVLVVGGGDGVGKLDTLVDALVAALNKKRADTPTRVTVVCGRNAALQRSLQARYATGRPHTVVVHGFVSNMHELMGDADILLSKAGPGTIAEAATLGLPVVLTNFLPGQERGNARFVSDHGFGVLQKRPARAANLVADWLDNPDKLVKMSRNAFNAAEPDSTARIAADIADILFAAADKRDRLKHDARSGPTTTTTKALPAPPARKAASSSS